MLQQPTEDQSTNASPVPSLDKANSCQNNEKQQEDIEK
jgi:hypothetical protein